MSFSSRSRDANPRAVAWSKKKTRGTYPAIQKSLKGTSMNTEKVLSKKPTKGPSPSGDRGCSMSGFVELCFPGNCFYALVPTLQLGKCSGLGTARFVPNARCQMLEVAERQKLEPRGRSCVPRNTPPGESHIWSEIHGGMRRSS